MKGGGSVLAALGGALALLAQASGGQAYSAGPDDVEPVLLMIWREL